MSRYTLTRRTTARRLDVLRARCVIGMAVVAAVSLGLSGVASAQPSSRVGPDQAFRALVNGHSGYPAPVTINMACFGPSQPGQTGHPTAGQSVTVLLGAATVSQAGFTGPNATSIGVFFGPPPPASRSGAGPVTFTRYGVPKAIPTSLVLPCSGTGRVTFVPLPMSPPTSRAAVVPVRFVGQP
jgi:hypothetical protein